MTPNTEKSLEQRVEELYGRMFGRPRAEQEAILAEHERIDPAVCREVQEVLAYEPSEEVRQIPDLIGQLIPACLFRPAQQSPPVPSSLPGYGDLVEIGRGGFGVVCRAMKARTELEPEEVALKVIWVGEDADEETRQRILAEPRKMSKLPHPYIVRVHETKSLQGWLYYEMEYVRGGTFREWMTEARRNKTWAVAFLIRVARAVYYAHQRGIIHYDLKPENILLDGVGHPKVADFGLARQVGAEAGLAHSVTVGWTPGYVAPERFSGEEESESVAIDIYSMGAILFEVYMGDPPYRAGFWNEEELRNVRRQLSREAGRDLAAVILKCLEKDPGRRYGSAMALAADLNRWRKGYPVKVRPINRWFGLGYGIKRRPVRSVVLGAVALVLALACGFAVREYLDHRAAWKRQEKLAQELRESVDQMQQGLVRARGAPEGDVAPWREVQATAEHARGLIANENAVVAVYREQIGDLYAEILTGAERALEAKTQRERNARMLARLLAIRLSSATPVRGNFGYSVADRAYAGAFREYDVDFDPRKEEEVVARLRSSPLREQLAAALIDWMVLHMKAALISRNPVEVFKANFFCQRLREMARRADVDQKWNRQFHAALASPFSASALRRLAQTENVDDLPPATAALLGEVVGDADPAQGVQLLQRAQTLHPHDFWINHFLAMMLMELPEPAVEEALRFRSICVALEEQNSLAHNLLGYTYARAQRLEEARDGFRRALKLDPSLAVAQANLITTLAELEGLEKARQAFENCGTLRRDNSVRHAWANVLLDSGAYAEATDLYQQLLDQNPNDGEAWYCLGRSLHFMGQYDRALEALRKPSARHPEGSSCETIPQLVRRIERLIRLQNRLAIDPGLEERLTADETLVLAELHLGKGDYVTAAALYERGAHTMQMSDADLVQASYAAVMTGCAEGIDLDPSGNTMHAHWRRRALDWLREVMSRQLGSVTSPLSIRARSRQVLSTWRKHLALASVREADGLSRLHRSEQEQWQKFWADVVRGIESLSQAPYSITKSHPR